MGQVKLSYQGANSLVLKKDTSTLLIDPYYSRVGIGRLLTKIGPNPRRVAEGLRSIDAGDVSGILLTHTHFDHALDAVEVIQQKGGILYGSDSAVNLAKGAELSPDHYQKVSLGEPFSVECFQIVLHPSKHVAFPPPLSWLLPKQGSIQEPLEPPAWFWDYRCGAVFAIQVDRMLIFGSAGYTPGAYEDLDIETVVLGVGGLELKPFNYLRDLYHEVVVASGARQVMISHWDNFFIADFQKASFIGLSKQTLRRVKGLADQHGQSVALLRPGETYLV